MRRNTSLFPGTRAGPQSDIVRIEEIVRPRLDSSITLPSNLTCKPPQIQAAVCLCFRSDFSGSLHRAGQQLRREIASGEPNFAGPGKARSPGLWREPREACGSGSSHCRLRARLDGPLAEGVERGANHLRPAPVSAEACPAGVSPARRRLGRIPSRRPGLKRASMCRRHHWCGNSASHGYGCRAPECRPARFRRPSR